MHNPYSIQIELSNGCTRFCDHCGIQAIWSPCQEKKFMKFETAEKISEDLGSWLARARIEYAMFGEPTLNPDLHRILSAMRKNFPSSQQMLNTNGDTFFSKGTASCDIREKIASLFDSGLNILAVNVYDTNDKFEERFNMLSDIGYKCYEYPEFNHYYYKSSKEKVITVCKSISLNNGIRKTRTIWNHGGNVPDDIILKYGGVTQDKLPLHKMCVNPFREIAIRYDGSVNICCMDVKSEYRIGNTNDSKIRELFFSEKMQEARRLLLAKNRKSLLPCCKCNSGGGFRKGFENKWFDLKEGKNDQ